MASAHFCQRSPRNELFEEWCQNSGSVVSNRVNWLRQASLFRGLSPSDIAEVASAAKERKFPAREPIFCEEDPVRFVFVIISGRVKVTQFSRRGKEVILRINGAGEIVNEISLGPGSSHRLTALPIESCHLLAWELRMFQVFTQRFSSLQANVTDILVSRLDILQQRFCDLATERVPQRLARTLLGLTRKNGEPASNTLIGLSCEELAHMTGTTVFTVSRLLSQWTECGIIRTERRSILIENLSDLTDLADAKDS
jgi:CRP-like cAMP-binding protein